MKRFNATAELVPPKPREPVVHLTLSRLQAEVLKSICNKVAGDNRDTYRGEVARIGCALSAVDIKGDSPNNRMFSGILTGQPYLPEHIE
jgi:hypothetical protein